jgi:ribosome-associated protein
MKQNNMQEHDFELKSDFIELIKLLKILQIAESGGQAQLFVENGEVVHNGEVEFRKRAKLRKGDTIEIFDIRVHIK